MRRLLLCLLLALPAVPAFPGAAHARSEGRTLGYQRKAVWSTVVRFLAVDEHAKVLDKDAEAGYVLFEVTDDGTAYHGSLEIITIPGGDGRPNIKFAIDIVDRPLWREVGMLQRLEQKVRHELGSPPPPPKKQPRHDEPERKPDHDKSKHGSDTQTDRDAHDKSASR